MEKIKNLGLVGGGSVGKTTLGELFLYKTKTIDRIGKVEEGTTTFDYDPEEIKRKFSINTSIASIKHKATKLNILDTPGYSDFTGELLKALSVIDGCIFVIDAEVGFDAQAERILNYINQAEVPFCIFVNKLYKEGTDFYKVVEELNSVIPTDISKKFVCITLPIKDNGKLTDVINLLDDKKSINGVTSGSEYYDKLQEIIAETDDVLCEKYLQEGSLEFSQIKQALIQAIKERKVYPILCGSALEDIGVDILLDFVTEFLPNAWDKRIEAINLADNKQIQIKYGDNQPLIVYVFKVIQDPYVGEISYVRVYSGKLKTGDILYNPRIDKKEKVPQICHIQGKNRYEVDSLSCGDIGILVKFRNAACCDTLTADITNKIELKRIEFPDVLISYAINPKTKQDQEKISNALTKLAEEDPTFKTYYDHELSQTIISGLGELHLEVILANLAKRFSTEVVIEKPKIPYRETILKKSKGEGKYKRQTGGRGQYGHALLEIEPLPMNTEPKFEFVNKIFGGAIPAKYIPAVEKGVRETMQKGILAGYPILWTKVTLYDGSFHEVDSSDIAFNLAGSFAFKDAYQNASPVLLEPIMDVEVIVPEESVGDVIGDLNGRRGKILSIEPLGGKQKIKAYVPQAEMYKYFVDLRSITKDRGTYKMKFSHYEILPQNLAEKIIQQKKSE